MKKVVFIVVFLTLLTTIGFGQTGYTLSGFTPTDAKTMMENFRNANEPYDKGHRNSFWISRNDFTAFYNHLIYIKANGIRVYLAKQTTNSPTTLIFVATHSTSAYTYEDFFESTKPSPISLAPTYLGATAISFKGATLYRRNAPKPKNEMCYDDGHHIFAKDAFDMVHKLTSDPINIHGELFTLMDSGSSTQGFLYDLNDELKNNTNLSGIRIYIARQTKIKPGDTVYRHCFTFITTMDAGGRHNDNYECPSSMVGKPFRKPQPIGARPIIYDNGEECPTACDGSAFYQYP